MVRISGVDLPRNKQVGTGLTYIFGIGDASARKILKAANVSSSVRCYALEAGAITRIRAIIEKEYQTEGDLRRLTAQNVKRLKEIGSAKGRRHRVGLPVRGQRTRTNARTRKDNVKLR
jgi:small subunit ribosomal protein S13